MRLGTLEGNGRIKTEHGDQGSAYYHLTVFQRGSIKSREGSLQTSGLTVMQCFDHKEHVLVLEDEREVRIVLTRSSLNGAASFKASGPVPGF